MAVMFRTRRKLTICGTVVEQGEVVDLDLFDLPPGRGAQLVDARFGEIVTPIPTAAPQVRRSPSARVPTNKKVPANVL